MTYSWHLAFAELMETFLTPVKIRVEVEGPIMARAPESDVVLILNQGPPTPKQKERLCDGLRDSLASHILLEFKYTETVNEVALKKAIGYDVWYGESKELKRHQHQTYIVSSRTPSSRVIKEAGYQWRQDGILASNLPAFRDIDIISLNDLPDTPHNALFKMFSSKKGQKIAAFDRIVEDGRALLDHQLEKQIISLLKKVLKKEFDMGAGSVVDELKRIEESIMERIINGLTLEERLHGLAPEDCIPHFAPEECMPHFAPEDRLQGLSDEEILHLMEIRKKKQRS